MIFYGKQQLGLRHLMGTVKLSQVLRVTFIIGLLVSILCFAPYFHLQRLMMNLSSLQATFLCLMFLPSLRKFLTGDVMVMMMVSTRSQSQAILPPAISFCLYNQSK